MEKWVKKHVSKKGLPKRAPQHQTRCALCSTTPILCTFMKFIYRKSWIIQNNTILKQKLWSRFKRRKYWNIHTYTHINIYVFFGIKIAFNENYVDFFLASSLCSSWIFLTWFFFKRGYIDFRIVVAWILNYLNRGKYIQFAG